MTRDTNMLSSDRSVVTLLWSLIGQYTGAWRSHVRKKISLNDSVVSRNPKLGQAVARYGDIYSLYFPSLLHDFSYLDKLLFFKFAFRRMKNVFNFDFSQV